MDIFQDMIASAGLLGSQIYEIQEVWGGQSGLQYANNVLKTSPKRLQLFLPLLPSESPKVMGLAGIHNPDTPLSLHQYDLLPLVQKGSPE